MTRLRHDLHAIITVGLGLVMHITSDVEAQLPLKLDIGIDICLVRLSWLYRSCIIELKEVKITNRSHKHFVLVY